MKKYLFFLFLVNISLSLNLFAQKKVIDRIVAVVDNEIILESELNFQLLQYAAKEKVDPQNPEFRRMVLEGFIDNQCILAQARLDSILVTDDEVTQATEDRIKYLIQQYGSEEKLVQLAQMSLAKMRIEFRDEIRKQVLSEKMLNTKFGNIHISRRELEEFFNTYKDSLPVVPDEAELYHLMVYPKANSDVKNKVLDLANKILDSIKGGADFSVMAKRYSEHSSGANGGDLPWVKRGTFVKEFEEAAFALQTGQVSNVIETPLGIFIIKLIDRRGDNILVKQIQLKIKKSESDNETTIKFLKDIKDKVNKGEKFADLARKYTEDQQTKDFGGYLGKLTLSEIPEDMAKLVKGMKVGEISDPVTMTVGNNTAYHIVLLEKFFPSHKMTLETDMLRIENIAKNFKKQGERTKWLNEIRKNIYIDIRL
jgi:peptidyl-prolyl cis-trans isomerase SurA